ncbi:MAG: proteasome-activating nucleotidase [Methanobrevibacter sp.]|uniref:proteasome-activating nucleotidase n=1 Tax=Methanobrevibacter sp. TaxID=66852 RepID=UPI0025E84D72|nr:proteasome-activating nucleotidase [Methanobrevibacter sp.]MBR0272345.1 proteasome-activating nucleotidase [Methanobrevibacter sp.]
MDEKNKQKYKELMIRFRNLEKDHLLQGIENQKLERKVKELKKEIEIHKKIPQILATVVDRLDDDKVAIRGTVGHTLIVGYPKDINEELLIPGARVALNEHTMSIVEVYPDEKDAEVKAMEIEEKPDVNYEDIGGLETQIREIKETVELPLKHPEIFEEIGIDPPKGILLQGPPGTGKTLLAKAVAKQTNATFIKLVASEFVNKFLGEGARYVREVFELAREKTPSIIFIDEIDAIGTRRTENHTGGEKEVHRTLMQLLSELDGFDQRGDVGIIAATNRIDILDEALLRPGRFDRTIEVPLPNTESRKDILQIHAKKMKLDEKIDFNKLANLTEGFSGADLKAVCTEAGMYAIRSKRRKVIQKDFINAIEKMIKLN